jgi:hypothetical protein
MTVVLTLPRIQAIMQGIVTSGDLTAAAQYSPDLGINQLLTVGAAAGEVSNIWAYLLSITSGSPQTLDMTNLTYPPGNTFNLARLQGIAAFNYSTTAGQDLTIQGGASNPLFSNIYTVQAGTSTISGGVLTIFNFAPGWVTSGTVKTLELLMASGTNVQIGLALLGNTS